MRTRAAFPSRQRGTALIVALIALVAMIAAGFALFRSVDSANLAAGNYQFVRSAEQNIDLAINEALLAYMKAHPNAALDVNDRNTTNPAIAYYATQQAQTADGVPAVLANLPAPAWTLAGPAATGWPGEQIDAGSRQLRRYVIERLCSADGVATAQNCRQYELKFSKTSEEMAASSSEWLPIVRVSVRVDGPKNAVAYAQVFMKGE